MNVTFGARRNQPRALVVAPVVPFSPAGEDIDQRIQRVRRAFRKFGPLCWLWLVWMVWPNHAWDDKVADARCEDFGNFAVGAVLRAAHIPLPIGLRAAGAVTEYFCHYNPDNGHWWGSAPYGDDRNDYEMTVAGYRYAQMRAGR